MPTFRMGDRPLSKWLAAVVGLALINIWSQVPVEAGGAAISGVIVNWPRVKGKLPASAYLQLVKKQEQLKSITDKEGLAALESNLPRIPVRASGGFRVNLGNLPPGEYFIALQRGFAVAPILVQDGKPVLIKIPGEFPLDVGSVMLEMPLGLAPRRHPLKGVK
jgi:hypothetical protein